MQFCSVPPAAACCAAAAAAAMLLLCLCRQSLPCMQSHLFRSDLNNEEVLTCLSPPRRPALPRGRAPFMEPCAGASRSAPPNVTAACDCDGLQRSGTCVRRQSSSRRRQPLDARSPSTPPSQVLPSMRREGVPPPAIHSPIAWLPPPYPSLMGPDMR